MTEKKQRILANTLLIISGAIWGGGFIVMKSALDTVSINYLLAFRFTIAAAGLSYTLFSKKHPIDRDTVKCGAILGGIMYTAFMIQTYGLMYTTAGKNALLSSAYVIVVPFLVWAISKKRPKTNVFIAAFILFAGIAILSLQDDFSVNKGDALSLAGGAMYSLNIVLLDRFSKKHDVMQLTAVQFIVMAIMGWILGLSFETLPAELTWQMAIELGYCGLLASLLALTLMNVGIKYASPQYASLFMSTESPFGVLFGVLFLNEVLTGRMIVGCVMIIGALVLSQSEIGNRRKAENAQNTTDKENFKVIDE